MQAGACAGCNLQGKASRGQGLAKEIPPRDTEGAVALSVPRPSLTFQLPIPLAALFVHREKRAGISQQHHSWQWESQLWWETLIKLKPDTVLMLVILAI